jgi:hypothetical protein
MIMKDPQIAQTILQQMGGGQRLKMFVGGHTYVDHGNGLSFKFKGSKVANYMKVTLTPMDTYNVEIGKIWGQKYNVKKELDNVYFDQLVSIFEDTTKLYLSF